MEGRSTRYLTSTVSLIFNIFFNSLRLFLKFLVHFLKETLKFEYFPTTLEMYRSLGYEIKEESSNVGKLGNLKSRIFLSFKKVLVVKSASVVEKSEA